MHPFQLAFLRNVMGFTILGLIYLALRPATPLRDIPLFLLRAVLGVAAGAASFAALCAAKAFSLAPASIVSPMDNAGIVFSAALGYVFFSEVPNWNVAASAALIFFGCLIVVKRT